MGSFGQTSLKRKISCKCTFKVKRGPLAAPIGEARHFHRTNNKNLQIFFLRHASPLSGVKISLPIVLAQCKEHKKKIEARKRFCHTSPIDLEIVI
jgi:hypothetical protein